MREFPIPFKENLIKPVLEFQLDKTKKPTSCLKNAYQIRFQMEIIGETFTLPIREYDQLIHNAESIYDAWLQGVPDFVAFEEHKQEFYLVSRIF